MEPAPPTPPLDYGSRDTIEPRRTPSPLALLACAALTLLALLTCLRIEVLNWRAGFYLPRAAADAGKWRTAPGTEQGFRLTHIPFDRTLGSRPLSPEERREVRRGAANNELREVVATWGLGQYVVVPAALAISARVLLRRPTVGALAFAAGCCAIGVSCAAAMFYRGYFSSLGW